MTAGILILVAAVATEPASGTWDAAHTDTGPVAAAEAWQQGQGQQQRPQQAQGQQGRGQQARPAQGQQGRPQEAQPGRGQQGRPQEAQPGRGQQGRQQQAQPGRGQQGRPQQAQPGRGQQGRPQQAQPGRGQQGRPQEAQPGRGQQGRPQQAQPGRGQQQRAEPGAQRGGGRADPPGRAEGRTGEPPGLARGTGAGPVTPAEAAQRLREMPEPIRRLGASPRPHERMVAGAIARGGIRGLDPGIVQVRHEADRVVVAGTAGNLLLELDERRARDLGYWRLRRLGDHRPRAGAPAFCRSGAGHPVWGREWCLERGFGLGSRAGTIWSRGRIDDVIFRRGTTTRDRLARAVLIDVLGDVIFGRLALHALSLGHVEPLHGVWIAQPDAPRLLHVYSGDVVIAELVDLNHNDRADVIYVIQPAR